MQHWRSACAGLALAVIPCAVQAADLGILPALAPAYDWSGIYLGANGSLGLANLRGASYQGIIGGGHAGVNFQIAGPLVVGVEADVSASDLSTATSIAILGLPTSIASRTYGTGSLRGRLGFAVERFLVYGTGGYGFAANTMTATIAGVSVTDARLHRGLTYGGGVEFRVLPMLSVRGEYLRARYDSQNYFSGGIPSGAIDTNLIRIGISYIR